MFLTGQFSRLITVHKDYKRFCAHLERSSPSICRDERSLKRKSQREMIAHTLRPQRRSPLIECICPVFSSLWLVKWHLVALLSTLWLLRPETWWLWCLSVSRVLHVVQSAGLQNAWNERAAQKIESSWCERVTPMPALMYSLLFCCILFCSSLFYSILFCFSLFFFILFSFIVFRSILFLFRSIMLYFIQFYSILY